MLVHIEINRYHVIGIMRRNTVTSRGGHVGWAARGVGTPTNGNAFPLLISGEMLFSLSRGRNALMPFSTIIASSLQSSARGLEGGCVTER